MANKSELQREVGRLREQLRKKEDLLMAAAVKAEDMLALQDKYAELKTEVARLRRLKR